MNHDHADRIAHRDPCQCAAYGCPMLGTMATSTTGASEWWCFMHFGKEAGRIQALTVEINRREWLARAITDLRAHGASEQSVWETACKAAMREMAMQQRNDLKAQTDESRWGWIRRLENELAAMCRNEFVKPPKQVALVSKELTEAGPQRVRVEMPA